LRAGLHGRTKDAGFAVAGFEAHFDGCDSFFGAFGVVGQTGNLRKGEEGGL
jgi:hypothetical protein